MDSGPARLVEDALLAVQAVAPSDGAIAATAAPAPAAGLGIEAGVTVDLTARPALEPHAVAKRVLDVGIACLLVVLLTPVLALIALCIVLDSRGPVLYRATRVGARGRRLEVLKFRKMRCDAAGGPLTVAGDQRFTRIGGWLARTKLDELPQLFNVLRGDMSLIGPRPEDRAFVARHADAFDVILRVRPGITGLSQLAYRAESRILDRRDPVADYERRVLPQKLALDRLYVSRANPWLDLQILLWTFVTTFMSVPVSVDRTTGRIKVRLGRGGRRTPAHGWWAALPNRAAGPQLIAPRAGGADHACSDLDQFGRESE